MTTEARKPKGKLKAGGATAGSKSSMTGGRTPLLGAGSPATAKQKGKGKERGAPAGLPAKTAVPARVPVRPPEPSEVPKSVVAEITRIVTEQLAAAKAAIERRLGALEGKTHVSPDEVATVREIAETVQGQMQALTAVKPEKGEGEDGPLAVLFARIEKVETDVTAGPKGLAEAVEALEKVLGPGYEGVAGLQDLYQEAKVRTVVKVLFEHGEGAAEKIRGEVAAAFGETGVIAILDTLMNAENAKAEFVKIYVPDPKWLESPQTLQDVTTNAAYIAANAKACFVAMTGYETMEAFRASLEGE